MIRFEGLFYFSLGLVARDNRIAFQGTLGLKRMPSGRNRSDDYWKRIRGKES